MLAEMNGKTILEAAILSYETTSNNFVVILLDDLARYKIKTID